MKVPAVIAKVSKMPPYMKCLPCSRKPCVPFPATSKQQTCVTRHSRYGAVLTARSENGGITVRGSITLDRRLHRPEIETIRMRGHFRKHKQSLRPGENKTFVCGVRSIQSDHGNINHVVLLQCCRTEKRLPSHPPFHLLEIPASTNTDRTITPHQLSPTLVPPYTTEPLLRLALRPTTMGMATMCDASKRRAYSCPSTVAPSRMLTISKSRRNTFMLTLHPTFCVW